MVELLNLTNEVQITKQGIAPFSDHCILLHFYILVSIVVFFLLERCPCSLRTFNKYFCYPKESATLNNLVQTHDINLKTLEGICNRVCTLDKSNLPIRNDVEST